MDNSFLLFAAAVSFGIIGFLLGLVVSWTSSLAIDPPEQKQRAENEAFFTHYSKEEVVDHDEK